MIWQNLRLHLSTCLTQALLHKEFNAVVFAVSYFVVATSEYSEALSVAALPMKDRSDSDVALAMMGHSSVA